MARFFNTVVLLAYLILPLESIAADRDFVLPVARNEIKIMNYNVQNLFDAEHDEGKNDFEFLPTSSPHKSRCQAAGRYANSCFRLDWTNEKVELKISQIKKVVAAQGVLPDVLVLIEVENPKVIARLAAALGFDDFRMTTSPDKRGIDNAILFRTQKMKLVEYYEAEIEAAHHPTRNLSAAAFQLDRTLGGGVLAVFANHWPSQASPTPARLGVAKQLQKFVERVREDYKNGFDYIVTGDFNTLEDESPNPIDSVLLSKRWSGGLIDVRETALNDKKTTLPELPPGTYYYDRDEAWNQFDRFFVNPELNDKDGLDVDLSSYRIHAPEFLSVSGAKGSNGVRVPFEYEHNQSSAAKAGYSDHFSVVMKLRYE
jgi:predicted extracellular nuclease